jgi:hypothetical protein
MYVPLCPKTLVPFKLSPINVGLSPINCTLGFQQPINVEAIVLILSLKIPNSLNGLSKTKQERLTI